jgi:hypothetical protein
MKTKMISTISICIFFIFDPLLNVILKITLAYFYLHGVTLSVTPSCGGAAEQPCWQLRCIAASMNPALRRWAQLCRAIAA